MKLENILGTKGGEYLNIKINVIETRRTRTLDTHKYA
jgi:hypothetical protein